MINTLFPMQHADAFASKVVQKAAFKVAKEVAKDEAVNMSFNMMMNYKYTPKDEREKIKKPDEGYTMICLPENKKNDVCEKPMQVKNSYTSSEKKSIGNQVEKALDSKTGNKGFLKLLNWLVPVWIVGTAFTVIDLLVDGDISSFLSDLGYGALVELGFIKPLGIETEKTTVTIPPNFEETTDPDSPDKDYDIPDNSKMEYLGSGFSGVMPDVPNGIKYERIGFESYGSSVYGLSHYHLTFRSNIPYLLNGDKIFERGYVIATFKLESVGTSQYYKTKKLGELHVYKTIYPYNSSNKTYVGTYDVSSENIYLNRTHTTGIRSDELNHLIHLTSLYVFDELVEKELEPMPIIKPQGVPVIPPGTVVKAPSPASVPTKDSSTGKTVKPAPGSTPDDVTWIDTDGNVVPEDKVVNDDIIVEETPDGDIIKNPDPEGIPGMGEGSLPPPIKPPVEPEFPEGPTCDASLVLPKFGLLFRQVSQSFPFSIPWDLKSGFDALFSEMGNGEPKFTYKFNFNGEGKVWNVEIPEYFKSWKPFTDSLLIFVFDVGILYGIYRLLQGGGS